MKKLMHGKENSSLTPLLQLVVQEEEEGDGLNFIELINRPSPKPWVPIREIQQHVLHPIISTHEDSNKHGHHIILKICNAQTKTQCEVYLPQCFALCISSDQIEKCNANCGNMCLVVAHKLIN
ncbi:uncharacterized protein LOC120354332 isoform X2 [Nilaparvata lugens]|nr:uncharacterized protein LOC120354332 isoform X2 [Nilaparvata lugens]